MYEKLTSDFKKALTDRQLERNIILSYFVLFLIYLIVVFSLWGVFKHWAVILLSNIVLILLCGMLAYTCIFLVSKKTNNYVAKDYIHFKRVYKSLKNILKRDVDILLPLIKTHGINTRSKVQEAIRHYQSLLLRKSNKGFAICSVLSLTISIAGIFFSALNYKSNEDLVFLLILLFSIMMCATLLSILVKVIYRSIYYALSEYSLYERIEEALSEIWMKSLIK